MTTTVQTCTRAAIIAALLITTGCSALRRPGPQVDRSQDARILQAVEAAIAAQPAIPAGSVRVEVDGAMVILHGSVPGLAAWQCAVRTAQLVGGVRSVTDYLVLVPGPREVRCLTG